MSKLLIVVFIVAMACSVWGDSTGYVNPTAATDEGDWANPTYVYSSDNSHATVNAVNQHILRAIFELNITSGSTIDGMRVAVEGKEVFLQNGDTDVALGVSGYTPSSGWGTITTFGTVDAVKYVGASDSLWGLTWNTDSTNSANFSVLLRDANATAQLISIDQIQVCVWYTLPVPTVPMVTSWSTEHKERADPQDDANFGYVNPDSTHLVDATPRFSAICEVDSANYYYIKVGDGTGESDYWDSGWLTMADTVYKDARTKKITYDTVAAAGNADDLKDGYKYYWSIALCHTVTGDTSDFSAEQTFHGYAPVWADSNYNNRQNIRFLPNHDAIAAGDIIEVPIPTGYGHTFAENALSLDGGQGQMIYHQGWSYLAYLGYDISDGSSGNYIIKQDHSADPDTFSAYYCVEDDVDSLMKTYGDWHYFPQIIISKGYLHFIRNGHDNQAAYYISSDSSFADSGINITNWETATHPPAFKRSTYIRLDDVSNGDVFATFRNFGDTTIVDSDTLADPAYADRGYYCMARLPYNSGTKTWGSWTTVKSSGTRIRDYIIYYWDDVTEQNSSMYCGGMSIDGNDRMHIVPNWYEGYSGVAGGGRAISHMYSDYDTIGTDTGYVKWYELGTTDSIGVTTSAADSTNNVHWATITPIDTCGYVGDDKIGLHTILVNADIMVLDDNNNPVIFWPEYDSLQGGEADECSLFCARWIGGTDTGQHWDIYNVSAETGYLAWHTRLYGAANIVNNMVSWFFITKPDSGGDYYAGENVRVRGKGFLTEDSAGVNWVARMMSGNSGSGIGRLNTYKGVPDSIRTGFVQKRKQNLVYMQDRIYGKFRADGNDIRIFYTAVGGAHTELDRVPLLAYQLDETVIAFEFGNFSITANAPATQYGAICIYWNYDEAGTPPANPDNVWIYEYYGCEVDSADGVLSDGDSLGLMDANIVSNGFDIGVSTVYADRMWSGNQYATTTKNVCVCTLTVTANSHTKDVYIHIRPMAISKTASVVSSYVELLDGTDVSRVYIPHGDTTISYINGSDSVVTSIRTLPNQYYTLKFHVDNTNGITAILNDRDTIFAEIDSIVQFDKIIIYGQPSTGMGTAWDVLTIERYMDNGIDEWLTPEQVWSSGRKKAKELLKRR